MGLLIYALPGVNLGMLPDMLDENDPRSARDQLDANYRHGGGWQPFHGFSFDHENQTLHYPGDPPMHALAAMHIREEMVVLFECDWVMILQRDASYEIARMD
ncbi:MAG TPA: hypothetical protein VHT52_11960 [Stellaceae bacterium]|jgi:hypothetical protein|nr:hypothetical protein [Stellaceae bacterium]